MAVVLKHDDFKTNDGAFEEIYTVSRWCSVTEEGPSDFFFSNDELNNRGESNGAGNDAVDTADKELPAVVGQINSRGMQDGDVLNLQGQVEIDDDNAPAPENIPSNGPDAADEIFSDWGHDGVC